MSESPGEPFTNYVSSVLPNLTPPYNVRSLLEAATGIVCLLVLPDFRVFVGAIAFYNVVLPSVTNPGPPKMWPHKREWYLLCMVWFILISSLLFEADVPYTKDERRLVADNGTSVYISFDHPYPRCILERQYKIEASSGCGNISTPDMVMHVVLPDTTEECRMQPQLRCNFLLFSGKPLCWDVGVRGLTRCASEAVTVTRVPRTVQYIPRRRIADSADLPTSVIPLLGNIMAIAQYALKYLGGPQIKNIVDSIAIQAFPYTLVFDLALIAFAIRITVRHYVMEKHD